MIIEMISCKTNSYSTTLSTSTALEGENQVRQAVHNELKNYIL
jgi:hypothetical protein